MSILCRFFIAVSIFLYIVPSDGIEKGPHTNNWAVIVDTSRFWFNYRHEANALSVGFASLVKHSITHYYFSFQVYYSVKRLGIPDSNIILMIADEMACNPLNPHPATIYSNSNKLINLFGDDIEIDYKGYEVTATNLVRVLTGRHPASTPRSKRLLTDESSNVILYMSGHGGDGFLKFQDAEEISNFELADAFEQMHQKNRYKELMMIVDSCQAASMHREVYSPNVIGVASSLVGEDSLSHHSDPGIGVHVIDRYTYALLEFLEKQSPYSTKTLADFLKICPRSQCMSTVGTRTDLYSRNPKDVSALDFFGSRISAKMSKSPDKLLNFTATTGLPVKKTPEFTKDSPTKFQYVDQMSVL